ncbi:MAG: polysaccharide lyase family protein, partial [Verrucomicrobiota bacterium]
MKKLMSYVVLGLMMTIGLSQANTTLWRIGQNNNSFSEFGTGAPPGTYAVPSDWATRSNWTAWKQILHGNHNPIDITYNLSSVPNNGVEFSFRSMWAHVGVPQLAVYSNTTMVGLIQIWGERGVPSQNTLQFRKIYKLYIPKEFLKNGSNTLRVDIAPHTYETSTSPQVMFRWDYLQLVSLSSPANEPIHGDVVYMGSQVLQKDVG